MEIEIFQQRFLSNLNPQQLEAATTINGPILLLAVPGSGKTTVLVTRLGYMVHCCGIAPESILTLTYTVAATKEMKRRFAGKFGNEYADKMAFWTINGLSARIILYYSKYHGKAAAFQLLESDADVNRILISIYQQINRDYPTESTVKSLRTAITYAKNMMFKAADIEAMDVDVDNFPQIFKAYTESLTNNRLMDYDDQMVYAYRILRTVPAVLEKFQKQYQYVCVDESQDTSKIQHAIIALLAMKKRNIFMVGDEDQSIYGFRAAFPEALMSFEKTYPRAKVLLMESNYRSTEQIVALANEFVKKNRFRRDKTIQATQGSGTEVQIVKAANRSEQYQQLLEVARNCTTQTAVLYRNNESSIPLVDMLERNSIPYNMRSMDATFFSHRIVSDISDFIQLAYNPKDVEAFMRIYFKMGLFISKSLAQQACARSRSNGTPILQELSLSGKISTSARHSINAIHTKLCGLSTMTAEKAVACIWNYAGYKEYVKKNNLDAGKFEILRILAKNESNAQGLLRRLNELSEIVKTHENTPSTPFLLSTIHSSKGLEYEKVYLIDAIDEIFPSTPANWIEDETDSETIRLYEEERRLFYVGMTRAKRELNIFDVALREQSFVRECCVALGLEKSAPAPSRPKKLPDPYPLDPKSFPGMTPVARNKVTDISAYTVGCVLVHKTFGPGRIESITGKFANVYFGDQTGFKKIDLKACELRGTIMKG